MILPVNVQIYYFLSTVIAGIAVGIMFDSYRIIIGINSPSKILTAISDVLFWVLSALLIFIFFLYTNNGDLRYYTFVGLILGIFLYFKLASKRFIMGLRAIIYFILKLFRIVIIMIVYPCKYVIYFIRYIVFKIKVFVKYLSGKIRDRRNKRVKRRKEKSAKKAAEPKKVKKQRKN